MKIDENILSESYYFKEVPRSNLEQQFFLNKIHKKNAYTSLMQCPFCKGKSVTKISERDGKGLPSEIVICHACDGCFKLKRFTAEANAYYYEHLSYRIRGKSSLPNSMEALFKERVRSIASPLYYFLTHFLELDPKKDFILELGANDGANLYPWHQKGFKTLGIDLDPARIEFARKKGLDVICGDFTKVVIEQKPKVIILSHVLEHVLDVHETLNYLTQILSPTGYFFIEVPGIRSQGLGRPLQYFDVEHNYNFDMKSLISILRDHSFNILYSDEYIRCIGTSVQNLNGLKKHARKTIGTIKISFLNKMLKILSFKNKKLLDLLKLSEKKTWGLILRRKLQTVCFTNYYATIEQAGRKEHPEN